MRAFFQGLNISYYSKIFLQFLSWQMVSQLLRANHIFLLILQGSTDDQENLLKKLTNYTKEKDRALQVGYILVIVLTRAAPALQHHFLFFFFELGLLFTVV